MIHQLFVYLLAEMSKFYSKFSILKTSKIEEFGVKKFQKITFESNFTLKKWFLEVLVPKISIWKFPSISVRFLFTFWPISKQTADVQKNVDGIEWPAIDALCIGYHSFSVTSMVREPQLKRCFVNKQLTYSNMPHH